MDRRNTNRLDIEITCYVASNKVVARPIQVTTKNVSRSGMLMRWDTATALPVVGKKMTVEMQLPENSEFGPRVMQCRATVIRIVEATPNCPTVALKIHSMKFVPLRFATQNAIAEDVLATMPLSTLRTM